MKRDEANAAISAVLDRITQEKVIDADGKVSFHGWAINDYLAVLNGLDLISSATPQSEHRRIVWSAVVACARLKKPTPSRLRGEIAREEREFQQRPLVRRLILTSVSIRDGGLFHRVVRERATIRVRSRLPAFWLRERDRAISMSGTGDDTNIPMSFSTVTVSAQGRTDSECVDIALSELSVVRSIWNLYFNRQRSARMSHGGRRKPINEILLGPVHTLHRPTGHSAKDAHWYEPEFRASIVPKEIGRDAATLLKFEKNVIGLLRTCRYREEVERALRRYAHALDDFDWHRAFVNLWGALEQLTGTGFDDSRATIRRAAAPFVGDFKYAEHRLNMLRNLRNRHVHADHQSDEIEAYLFMVKKHVEVLIEFHLAAGLRVDTMKEAAEFLELGNDLAVVNGRLRKLRQWKAVLSKRKG